MTTDNVKLNMLTKLLLFVLICVSVSNLALANSATIDGISWTYTENNGGVSIGDGKSCAVPSSIKDHVEIPDFIDGHPVVNIAAKAFWARSGITSVSIPASVTNIGRQAFASCSGLTTVTIPSGVISIANYAFSYCSRLSNVKIPDSVTKVGEFAFNGCSDSLFDTQTVPGVKIVDGWAVDCIDSLPNDVRLTGVRHIGDGAFSSCAELLSIEIPDGVMSIGNNAFLGCSGLTNVTMSDSVVSIGYGAFQYCRALKDLRIGNGVTMVGNYAFGGCNGLLYVTIPKYICSRSLSSVFPDAYQSITSVVIGEGTTAIGIETFNGCSSITSITIPDSVVSIKNCAFSSCSNSLFDTHTIPGVKLVDGWVVGHVDVQSNILDLTGIRGVGDSALAGCSNFSGVIIPEGVMSIGDESFSGCTELVSVTIPIGVTEIGYRAFYACEGLVEVKMPDTVISIGEQAFDDCGRIRIISIPQCVCTKSIASVFSSAYLQITNVTISAEVSNIDSDTFDACSGIESFQVAENNMSYKSANGLLLTKDGTVLVRGVAGNIAIPSGVMTIKESAFGGCGTLTSVTIPDSVKSIGSCAFYECSGLVDIIMGSEVTSIGNNAFCGCTSLSYVALPNNITSIGDSTFYGCSGLTYMKIPEGVTSIGKYAFFGCKGLKHLSIPNSVTSIGNYAFRGCEGLTDLTIGNGVVDIGISAFSGCRSVASVTIPNSVTTIGAHAFEACSGLTSVTIGNGITSIPDCMFAECTHLKEVIIPIKVKSIGEMAFYNCSCLSSITIPVSVTRIKEQAFYGCDNIVEATVPGWKCDLPFDKITKLCISPGTTSVAEKTFEGCTSLRMVTFPESLTDIGTHAFLRCSNLMLAIVPQHLSNVGEYTSYVFTECSPNFDVFVCDYDICFGDGLIWSVDNGNLKSCNIGNNSKTYAEVTVQCSGKLGFKWKASSEADSNEVYDYAYLSVDGIPQGTRTEEYRLEGIAIGGKTDSVDVIIEIKGDGPHTIRWVYQKDDVDDVDVGDDCVWLGEISWIPNVTVSYDISGADGQTPSRVSGLAGTTVTLPQTNGINRPNYTFIGWSDGTHVYEPGAEYTLGRSDVVIAAQWSANTIAAPIISSEEVANGGTIELEYATITISADQVATIHYTTDGSKPSSQSPLYTGPFVAKDQAVVIKAIAVRDSYFDSEITTFTFTRKPFSLAECLEIEGPSIVVTDEGSGWSRVLGSEAHDGIAALKSNVIGDGQTNWVQLTVCGTGTLSFWWKVSCEGKNRGRRRDGCIFLIDGDEIEYFDGTTNDWSEITVEVPGQGEHIMKWVYGKNDNGTSDGEDCAWLGNVVWTPATVDPLPEIVSESEVLAALTGSTDQLLIANVTNVVQYASYRNWALSLTNEATTTEMVKASNKAWLSYALGTDALIEKEFSSKDIQIESFKPSTASNGEFEFVVGLDGINVGAGSVAEEMLKENLKKVFGLEGGASLDDLSTSNVNITFCTPENGKVKFTAGPNDKNADAKTFFMKVKMAP